VSLRLFLFSVIAITKQMGYNRFEVMILKEKYLKLLPAVTNSGFAMEDWYVWCGSVIKEKDTYYLFAARWPKETGFPNGYLTHSEIVLASTKNLSKPFVFEKTLISKRDGEKWDGFMAHNPFILKKDDLYLLYYIGSPDGSMKNRAIGYAWSKNLKDGWIRSEKAIPLPPNANNPAVLLDADGSVLLYYRDGNLRVSVARTDSFDGEYQIVAENLFPSSKIEDMFVYKEGSDYIMIAEDALGFYTGIHKAGVRFTSKDGIHWDETSARLAYDFDVDYDDGSAVSLQRRERPFLFRDNDKAYLFSTAKLGGEDKLTGGNTWNMVQEIDNL